MRLLAACCLASAVMLGAITAGADPPKRVDTRGLTVVAASAKPAADYEAEVYSGVPLDGAYAKERGLSKGLVWMVFEKQRRATFRVPKDKIKKIVRLLADDVAPVMVVKTTVSPARTKIDVLETAEGTVAVETVTANAGIFTTSDVYVFARGASIDARLASVPPATRDRLKRAITLASTSAARR